MRILALAILAIGTISIGSAAAQHTIRLIRFACMCTVGRATITNAATHRCLSATRRHRAGPRSASSIHISRARRSPRVIGGIAASTKAYLEQTSSMKFDSSDPERQLMLLLK
jgi:hypothetical protein